MVLGAMIVGGMVGHYAARRQFESMSAAQEQQSQISQAQARLANQAQASNQGKKDTFQELEKLGSLKQRGILTDEEFQKLKARLLSNI
jgi:membrane protease subunit (stomatin/prohibitin family)